MENNPSQQPTIADSPTPLEAPLQPKAAQFEMIKNILIKGLIGSLIAAAGVAVIAVLLGSLSGIVTLSIETLVLVMVHAIAALTYVNTGYKSDEKGELTFFSNTLFVLIILSFFTSVLGVWSVLGNSLVGQLYLTYFIVLFGALHANMLYQTTGKTKNIDNIATTNYFFMVAVICFLLVIIYSNFQTFPDFFYRLLAALAIIDATLTIVAVALHRLYLGKHPEEASALFATRPQEKRHISPFLILFGIYLILQIGGSVFAAVFNRGH